jgi:hypothetical protein
MRSTAVWSNLKFSGVCMLSAFKAAAASPWTSAQAL